MANLAKYDDAVSSKIAFLWKNHSSKQITQILASEGYALTKHAVAGKIARMGLTVNDKETVHPLTGLHVGGRKRSVSTKGNYSLDGSEASRIISAIKAAKKGTKNGPKIVKEPFKPRTVDVASLNIGLMDLTSNTCRWPTCDDTSAMTYCGLFCEAGDTYCIDHHSLAYKPAPQRHKGDTKPFYRDRRRAA